MVVTHACPLGPYRRTVSPHLGTASPINRRKTTLSARKTASFWGGSLATVLVGRSMGTSILNVVP